MRKLSVALFISLLSFAATSQAQTQSPSTEIRESTDPAKAAEVEQRAMEIQQRQEAAGRDATSGDSGEATSGERSQMKKSKARKAKRPSSAPGASGSSGSEAERETEKSGR